MKIAFVVHDYHRAGGHSRYVAELATRFAQDHEVHVYANRIERAGETNIQFHAVPAWRLNALTTVLSFIVPATFQIGSGFDIIHSQGFCALRGNVFTAHIVNRAWHRALEKLEGGATIKEKIFNAVGTTLEYALYRFTRGEVIAISKRVAADLVSMYHCRAPIHVIHHGVDLDVFTPANRDKWRGDVRREQGLSDAEMLFLYVGDLRKGAGQCIQALAQIERGKLLFVSRSRTAPYERMAEAAGVSNRVVFHGPSGEIEKFYAVADAFVLPSPYDAFGMVVSEAMASALPVIVSREAGASELIEHSVNGLLLNDVSSVSELAGHMQSLERDRRKAMEMGCAASKSVEPMTWDTVASETLRVYEEAVRKAN